MTADQIMFDTDDDIFARPPRAVARQQQALRITCRVCNLGVPTTLDNDVLLCPECRRDPAASRKNVETWLAGVDSQEQAAYDAWSAVAAQHVNFWAKLSAPGRTPARDQRARQAHAVYALLLDAEAAYQAALIPLAAEQARLMRALEELDRI